MRRGSCRKRKSHSRPAFCIHAGALDTFPATTSSEPPTPTINGTSSNGAASSTQYSFFGELMATNSMSALEAFTSAQTDSVSASPKYPWW